MSRLISHSFYSKVSCIESIKDITKATRELIKNIILKLFASSSLLTAVPLTCDSFEYYIYLWQCIPGQEMPCLSHLKKTQLEDLGRRIKVKTHYCFFIFIFRFRFEFFFVFLSEIFHKSTPSSTIYPKLKYI